MPAYIDQNKINSYFVSGFSANTIDGIPYLAAVTGAFVTHTLVHCDPIAFFNLNTLSGIICPTYLEPGRTSPLPTGGKGMNGTSA